MKQAKSVWKAVEERRVDLKSPLADTIKRIDARAKTILGPMKEIEEKCKTLLNRWEYERKMEAARVEDEAMAKAEEEGRETPDLTVVEPDVFVPKVHTRDYDRIRIVDESLIPRQYMLVNMPALEVAVLQNGRVIPGVEKYVETIVVNR